MILVIDDDDDVRRTIMEALKVLAYPCREASDGAAGLLSFCQQRPRLVILDYRMPKMNGVDVAHEMRKIEPEFPIIFTSGFAEEGDLQRRLGPGTPVLHKPFRLGELAELIEESLAREPS